MDWDERAEVHHRAVSLAWSGRFNDVRGPRIASWVSTFRNGQLCEVVGDNCGSFNWSCQVRFKDGVQWMVRFAVPGRAINGDEKVRHEVATMQFIKTETKIPVPSFIVWGTSKDNPLGLGPFIIMDFIEGEPLGKILEVHPEPETGQTLREDISDRDLDIIYRQIANILLELSEHDFPRIGSLSRSDHNTCIDSRPLTLKMNETGRHGGVNISNHVSKTFSSATEYFDHVAEQDLQHLCEQPNSIDDIDDARSKYIHRSIFKAMLPRFVSNKHDHGPFKLTCDDFRFGNILVNNATDLKIVAVVDWEWAYAAPYQMLYSPPRWLLIKKPIRWDDEDSSIPDLSQYKSYFQKFVRILEEEESKRVQDVALPTSEGERMSSLMQQSMDDGKFWFHELVYSCFESADNPAWTAIREIIPNLDKFATPTDAELNAFVKGKMEQLRQYDLEWAIMKEDIDKKNAQFEALKEKVEREDKKRGI